MKAGDREDLAKMFPEGSISYSGFKPIGKEAILKYYRARDTTGVSILTMPTVKPPNKGHFRTSHFVLCREVVL